MADGSTPLFKNPQESLLTLLDYPENYLKRSDELCQIAPHIPACRRTTRTRIWT